MTPPGLCRVLENAVERLALAGLPPQDAAIRESEERLRLALEASVAGMWAWDLRTDVLVWSAECCRIARSPRASSRATARGSSRRCTPTTAGGWMRPSGGPREPATLRVRVPDRPPRRQGPLGGAPGPGRLRRGRPAAPDARDEHRHHRAEAGGGEGAGGRGAAPRRRPGGLVRRVLVGRPAGPGRSVSQRGAGRPPNADAPCRLADVRAVVHPDDLGRFDAALSACLADGSTYRSEFRIVRPDGTVDGWKSPGSSPRRRWPPLRLTGVSPTSPSRS